MGVLKDKYTFSGTAEVGDTFGNGYKIGQTFTAASSYTLESISLKVGRTGATGNLTVYLTATDGSGLPTGGTLSTGTKLEADIPTGSLTVISVPMTAFNIVSGTKYAIYSEYPNHSMWPQINIVYNYRTPSGYSGGNYILYTTSWANYTSYDLYFALYSPSPLPDKPINPVPANAATGVSLTLTSLSWESGS